MNMNQTRWRKSTYSSSNGGACIEVAAADGAVALRDSKDTGGPVLAFGRQAWEAFAVTVKATA